MPGTVPDSGMDEPTIARAKNSAMVRREVVVFGQ